MAAARRSRSEWEQLVREQEELPSGVVLRFEHRLDPRGLRDLAMAFGQEG